MNNLIYLATPYSGTAYREHLRFIEVTKAAGMLIQQGFLVYSPITHNHPVRQVCGFEGTFARWQKHDEGMILLCDILAVLPIPGWTESVGVQSEIKFAIEHNKKVMYVDTYDYKLRDQPFP